MCLCDYCCIRPRSVVINCVKCSPLRSINICFKCSINVNKIREHDKLHPMSTYKLSDIPLDDLNPYSWLSDDEMNLISMIETCGLGNWIDIGSKISKNPSDCQNHFEDIYLSRLPSPFNIYFQRFNSSKPLIGENEINESNCQIYPPMLIDNEQQKLLTYMPNRDEYEREYLNQAENNIPTLTIDEQLNNQEEQDNSKRLIDKAKLILLHSYKQTIQKRLQLKHFIRDYALGFNYSPDKEFDLHQISRFLSADEYERLIFNHRRIQSLLEELGCSTSSNGHNDQSQSRKKSPLLNSEKRRRRAPSIVVDESSSSISSSQSNLSFSSSSSNEELNLSFKRRSIRRVSSSSTNTSSKTPLIKEPLYTRRRVNQSDIHSVSQRMTRSTGNIVTTSDISWNSTDDDEMTLFEDYHFQNHSSTVASRTRSHTPPNQKQKSSPNGKRTSNHLNSSSKSNMFDPSDQSTPKVNRMLTRHQLVVQQTSPNKKRKILSTSNDDELIHI